MVMPFAGLMPNGKEVRQGQLASAAKAEVGSRSSATDESIADSGVALQESRKKNDTEVRNLGRRIEHHPDRSAQPQQTLCTDGFKTVAVAEVLGTALD